MSDEVKKKETKKLVFISGHTGIQATFEGPWSPGDVRKLPRILSRELSKHKRAVLKKTKRENKLKEKKE